MPSSIGHGLVALAVAAALRPAAPPRRYWVLSAACAVLPDVDAVGRPFGLGDLAWLGGHRALTHSLAFAAALAGAVVLAAFRSPRWEGERLRLWAALALGTASHGLLDALASYGAGVAFFAPLSWARYKLPWQPFRGILPEVLALWLPAAALLAFVASRRARPGGPPPAA